MQQLTLNIFNAGGLRFEEFFVSAANTDLLSILQGFATGTDSDTSQLFISAPVGGGKTHLLQACCYAASEQGQRVSYLPLRTLSAYGSDILQGLDGTELIAVDDLDAVLGDAAWEEALFDLINRTRIANNRLLFSARENPRLLSVKLPDLASRLIWGGYYAVAALSDEDRLDALRYLAQARGIQLDERVLEYLDKHFPRDIARLVEILDTLDRESLRRQSRITVPFVRNILAV